MKKEDLEQPWPATHVKPLRLPLYEHIELIAGFPVPLDGAALHALSEPRGIVPDQGEGRLDD